MSDYKWFGRVEGGCGEWVEVNWFGLGVPGYRCERVGNHWEQLRHCDGTGVLVSVNCWYSTWWYLCLHLLPPGCRVVVGCRGIG